MASLELPCALPFSTSCGTRGIVLTRFSSSINFPVLHYLRPPRLRSRDALAAASRRLTVLSHSDNGVATDLATDALKLELEGLQTEAEQVRTRANTARARFMRLTETVENLRVRAALDVKDGREEKARQLLEEKQKVLKALEKSKQRAELLDKLSVKLSEAISRKETQLIRALSSARLKMDNSRSSVTNVRIVSPREEVVPGFKSMDAEGIGMFKQCNDEDSCYSVIRDAPEICVESGIPDADSQSNDSSYENVDRSDKANAARSNEVEMFPDFLAQIDDQLNDIEIQLHAFMNVAAMILQETIGNTTNEKVANVKQICHDIQNTRARIRTFIGLK